MKRFMETLTSLGALLANFKCFVHWSRTNNYRLEVTERGGAPVGVSHAPGVVKTGREMTAR